MSEPLLFFIAAALLLAGFVKGVVGLGLPTVSIGLLAVTMQPSRAIAIVIVPAIVTNIWQTFAGPHLRDIIRRLWPLMAGTVIGIWLNGGMLSGPYARYGGVVLGVLLVIYAIVGLSKFSFSVARSNEKWIGGIVGLVTGAVSAATGVQVVPSMRFYPHQRRLAQRIDRTAGRGRDGERLRRHVHRPGGALADAAGSLPPLVFDRDDSSRPLSRRQRGLQHDGVVTTGRHHLHLPQTFT